MIHFVGAGPGAPDLITLRGAELLKQADVCIYAGSLVNPVLLGLCREDCAIYNSAEMTLEEVLAVMEQAETQGKQTVRLHTGDPCLYGAIREQMDALDSKGISYAITPGVSSFCGAAAAAEAEYTLPGVSQTVIITRMAGRTPVPEREGHRLPCRARGDDGDFSLRFHVGGFAGRLTARGLHGTDPGGAGLQGHLAGGKGRPVPPGRTGEDGERTRHFQDSLGPGRRFSGDGL